MHASRRTSKTLSLALTLGLLLTVQTAALACTSILVGKKATVDGSVMTSHTVDGWYDQRVVVVPGKTFPAGSTAPVYKNLCYQTKPTAPLQKVGEIPQVAQTYTYFHSGYPFMNEHQLMIGETTIDGREECVNETGWFTIEQLEVFALQRAKAAREAIKIMGALAEQYGYGDYGEALTLADTQEAWLFEIVGPGPLWKPGSGKPGAHWVAVRVPDDSVTVSTNTSRIGEVNPADQDHFLASTNLTDFAKDQGWWKPGTTFSFKKAYGENPYPRLFNQKRRLWRVYSTLAPSQKFDPAQDPRNTDYPLFVKPEKKLSVRDIMAILRDHYEGTPYDLTKGLAADPFGTPDRWKTPASLAPKGYENTEWERAISMFRCSYSFVSQSRSWLPDPVGGVAWVGMDAPHSTVYLPFYCGNTSTPKCIAEGKRAEFDRDSAFWAFQFVSNWANLRWDAMMKDIRTAQKDYEDEEFLKQGSIEKHAADLYKKNPAEAVAFLTDYSNTNAVKVVDGWWKLGWTLVGKYHDGYITEPSGKQTTPGYPTEWLKEVGFGQTMLQPKK